MDFKTLFLIAWASVCLFITITFYRWGKKALAVFPDIRTQDVKFRERFASGNSNQSYLTQMGGSRNFVDVIVTDKELWLKSMLMFAGISDKFDMIHKISLKQLRQAKLKENTVTLYFTSADGIAKQVSLILKRPQDFLKAIEIHLPADH